ncbi:MAG: HAMP domain-containing sensor histidine kinase [Bacteroidales bacterium]
MPSERLLKFSTVKIADDHFLQQFVKALPYVTAILDKERKIVLSNNILIDEKTEISVENFFGRPSGEPLNCLHTNKPYSNCEGNGICRYCGLPNVLIRLELSGKKETQETTINVTLESGKEKTYDVKIIASPLIYQDEKYTLLTIMDISEQKRKRALERIFFHDLLNKTGSLHSVNELLLYDDHKDNKEELMQLSSDIIKDLNEEILLHKSLMAAENGELKVRKSSIQAKSILNESINQIIQYPSSQGINIQLSKNSFNESFHSDPVLLKRILINMLKNAIEASKSYQQVDTGCYPRNNKIVFWVHNYTYIPKKEQIKIFERNYSTKGENRGLGTYSMKLLGDNYLNGKVYFKTDSKKGTTFYFELPKE